MKVQRISTASFVLELLELVKEITVHILFVVVRKVTVESDEHVPITRVRVTVVKICLHDKQIYSDYEGRCCGKEFIKEPVKYRKKFHRVPGMDIICVS